MNIGGADWSVQVTEERGRYWLQVVASAHGRSTTSIREGPFRRQDQAEKCGRELLAEVRRSLEDPGPTVVATISELSE